MKLDLPYVQAGRYRKGRRNYTPQMIVIHWSAGWGDDNKIADYFVSPMKYVKQPDGTKKKVPRDASYHFAIGRGGSIVQMVDTDDTAWHAGGGVDWEGRTRINERSIGVCLANRGPLKSAGEVRRAQEDLLFRGEHTKPGFHGYGKVFEGYPFEQVDALRRLVEQVVRHHPTITGVTGHEDLVKGKGDPGPAFNTFNPKWSDMGLVRHVKDWRTGEWSAWQ